MRQTPGVRTGWGTRLAAVRGGAPAGGPAGRGAGGGFGAIARAVAAVPRDPNAVEGWLRAAERDAAAAAGRAIVAGTEKLVSWHGGSPRRADLALVFVHGYTGSRQSLAPVLEQVAGRLGANLFSTRLAGGGLGADAIGTVTLAEWQRDVAEAWQLGRTIGRRVVLIGMSTGCPLVAWWVAAGVEAGVEAAALVLLSPNFWPPNRGVGLLLTPFGPLAARLAFGRYRDLSGEGELQDRYWTTRHHSRSLVPMMQAVQLGRRAPLERIACPALVVYTERDRVVSVVEIKRAYARLGSARKRLVDLPGADDHELAGTIHAPATVPLLTAVMSRFLQSALAA